MSAAREWPRLRVAAVSDIGRVRPNNEDAYTAAPLGEGRAGMPPDTEGRFDADPPVLLAVSDGMGGSAAGEVASALAVEALRRALPASATDWSRALREAVTRADEAVWRAAQQRERRGMGATLTAVCIHRDTAYIAEIGDSRAYLFREGNLRLLTHDQSYVQFLVDAGLLSEDEAEQSPLKNVILQCLGQGTGLQVDVAPVELQAGDVLLVCSDGLSNEVATERLREVLLRCRTPRAACRTLIDLANAQGGRDNITVIIAKVEDGNP